MKSSFSKSVADRNVSFVFCTDFLALRIEVQGFGVFGPAPTKKFRSWKLVVYRTRPKLQRSLKKALAAKLDILKLMS
jgi:hypothetical protein